MTERERKQITQEAQGTIQSAVYLLQYPWRIGTAIQALKDATSKLETLNARTSSGAPE